MLTTAEVTKKEVLDALKDLPDKDALPEALERLYVLYKIQKGLEASERGETLSHEEAIQRLSKWFV
jgi:predicted transcriptional regulator